MADTSDPTSDTGATGERSLVLDELDERLAAFNAFRKSDTAKADEILRDLGGTDPVARDIVKQLAGKRPLGHPCLLYTSPSPRDKRQSRMPSSA